MGRRLIDADKLKAHYAWWKGGSREMTMDEAKSDFDTIIDLQPTVEPVKHGRWVYVRTIINGEKEYKCSECNAPLYCYGTPKQAHYDWCYSCGARMDGEENG